MEEPGLIAKIFWPTAQNGFTTEVTVHSQVDVCGTEFDKFCKVSNFLKFFERRSVISRTRRDIAER